MEDSGVTGPVSSRSDSPSQISGVNMTPISSIHTGMWGEINRAMHVSSNIKNAKNSTVGFRQVPVSQFLLPICNMAIILIYIFMRLF